MTAAALPTYERLTRAAVAPSIGEAAAKAQRYAVAADKRAAMLQAARDLCDAAGLWRNTNHVRTAWFVLYRPDLLAAVRQADAAKIAAADKADHAEGDGESFLWSLWAIAAAAVALKWIGFHG